MNTAVATLAAQLRVRGAGCVPLPDALAPYARAVLAHAPALGDADVRLYMQAHPAQDTESITGLRELPNGRASYFYRRHAGLSAGASEPARGLLTALDRAWDELGRLGQRVLEDVGWEIPHEHGPARTLTSLAVQVYPAAGGAVDEHVDGCALTLVVMRAGDARLHLRDPLTLTPLVPRGDLACGVGVPGGGGVGPAPQAKRSMADMRRAWGFAPGGGGGGGGGETSPE
jgi:hypothetical protein